ncbi:flagellin, partial [Campylobacter hyointestinalis]
GFLSSATITKGFNQASVNLKYMNSGTISSSIAKAMGFFKGGETATDQSGGVNTFAGAQAMIDIAESAQKTLDRIRADLGSVQNQLVSTINNISVTQVNVKSAESQIRDVDFAEESANFSKYNILAQSGSYAMSQANAVQQNVLKLLQ